MLTIEYLFNFNLIICLIIFIVNTILKKCTERTNQKKEYLEKIHRKDPIPKAHFVKYTEMDLVPKKQKEKWLFVIAILRVQVYILFL